MASLPFPSFSWLQAPNSFSSSAGAGDSHPNVAAAAAAAAGVRLGRLLRRRLGCLLLSSSSATPEPRLLGALPGISDISFGRLKAFERYAFLGTLEDAFSASCLSGISFFDGKEPVKGFMDNRKFQFKSPRGSSSNQRLWTNVLLAVNVLAYVAQIATQGKLLMWGAKVNSLIDKGQLWRLVTSSLLHANVAHLLVNCFSLNSIGPAVEQLTGPRRFLAVYFTSALASSLMSYRFCELPAVGASGAIFGLVGSFATFIWRHRRLVGSGKQDLEHIARVIALNMTIGIVSRGIDNWGHLGGLLGGMAMSWFLGPAWQYQYRADDGRLVFADKAPIVRLINRKRLH